MNRKWEKISKLCPQDVIDKKPVLVYSILFALLAILVFFWFIFFDKSMILNVGDARVQHYPALVYVGQWGRKIIRSLLFDFKLAIPLWDFGVGYGSDIITTFNYYSLGDPLNIFAIVTPTAYIEYLYDILILLRMYLSGIGFYYLCRYFKINNKICLFTSLLYAFNFYNVYAGTMHIFFLNAAMYLPYLILGIEKIFKNEKPFLFIITVCLFTLSNFYFAYALILITVIYVLIRFFCLNIKKDIKKFSLILLKFFSFGLMGICMSSFILLPIIIGFFNSTRSSASSVIPMLYDFSYYERFIAGFLGNEDQNWRVTGYNPLGLLAVFYIFTKKKQHKTQKVLFIVFTVFLLLPIFGCMFNGFLYPSNRFGFTYHFLLLFITAYNLEDIINSTPKEKIRLTIISGTYLAVCLCLCRLYHNSTQVQYLILAAMVFVLALADRLFANNVVTKTKASLAVLSVLSILFNSLFYYFPTHYNYISSYMDHSKVYETFNTTSTAAFKDYLKEVDGFSRLQTQTPDNFNAASINGVNGTGYYFSYCADNVPLFNDELEIVDFTPYRYYGVDKSAFLSALASIKYYSCSDSSAVPYNYEYVKSTNHNDNKYMLYSNSATLPLGYTYDTFLTREEFNKLSAVEKREAMIQNVLVDEEISGLGTSDYKITSQEIPFKIAYSDNITATDSGFYVRQSNSKVTLEFTGKENSETYVTVKNFNGEYLDAYEIRKELPNEFAKEMEKESPISKKLRIYNHFYGSSTDCFYIDFTSELTSKEITLCNPKYRFYNGIHDFTVNMGYSEKPQSSVTINFPTTGFFSWDSISIVCQSMDNYESYVENLSDDILENVQIENNRIKGNISLDSKKALCLSVPYSKGWTAYVDGKKAEIFSANIWETALVLDAGEHTVELRYTTPGLVAGIIMSVIGFLSFFALLCIYKQKKYKKCVFLNWLYE